MLAQLFARRYLFSSKSRSVVNLISGLSVVAVAMPVAAMIILLSVFNGFEGLIKTLGSAFDAPLTITVRQGQTFDPAKIDTAALSRIPGVEGLSLILEQSALVEHQGRQATTTVRGVDDAYARVLPIDEAISAGSAEVRLGDWDQLVIGQSMAYMLGIRSLAEAEVGVYALRRNSFSSLLPTESYTRRMLPATGVFVLDLETEKGYALTSLRFAQELFNYPGQVSAILLRPAAGSDLAAIKNAAEQITGDTFRIQTREELNASFYRIMAYEKWGIFFISLLVLIIASFSIVGALVMLIVEKRRDIVTLRALGADTALIRRIFRREGALISALGAGVGVVIGVGASLLQQHLGLIEIPAETFLTKSYPVEFRMSDLLVVLVAFTAVTTIISTITVRSTIKNNA